MSRSTSGEEGLHIAHSYTSYHNSLSHTWPRNPYNYGNSQPYLPPHTPPITRSSNFLTVPPQAIQLLTRFDVVINKPIIHKTIIYKHNILNNSPI